MDNVKNDAYYIKKMLKDIKFIIEKTEGITLEALEKNEVLCDSVLFRLIQISEAYHGVQGRSQRDSVAGYQRYAQQDRSRIWRSGFRCCSSNHYRGHSGYMRKT